jgi:RNA polymerase sigma factor (sigma-70 family)
MAKEPAAVALDRVRLRAAAGLFADTGDGDLLNRCAAGPDEAAFAALVERHGAMVYGVCSRILRNPHDAEDACQATFLVLARKASSIRKRPSVASWLHGVARRTSMVLLRERVARRRHEREASAGEPQSTDAPDLLWSEVLVLLGEELDRLPERLRGPIVLCYLEGRTRDEAAAALRITHGRLHGLLQRGRALLHDRLAKRGVSLGAGFLTVGLSGGIGRALPPALAVRIAHGGRGTLGGREAVPALVSAQSTSTANEVLRAMFYARLKTASAWSAVCVAAAFALVGPGLFAPGFARDEEKKANRPAVAAPAPQPDPGAAPLAVRKVLSMATDQPNDFRHATIAVSNEQKSVLSRNLIVTDRDDPLASSSGLHLWTLGGEKPRRTHLGDSTTIGFVPRSTLCYVVGWGEGVALYDTRTHAKVGKPLPHELREDTMPLPAVSPDGAVMATRSKLDHVQFWNPETATPVAPATALRGIVWAMEFSADGKWLFSRDGSGEFNVWDPRTGKRAAGPFRQDAATDAANYSPGSQRLATAENSGRKEATQRSELVIRSSKDWGVVQRVKLDGLIREVKWIDDAHLLIVGEETTRDGSGRPTTAGRNLLHVVALKGEKPEVRTVVRGTEWIGHAAVAPDGKHFVASITIAGTSCWKLGEPKPIWTKPAAQRTQFGGGDWVLLTYKGGAVVCSLADGKELWRQDGVEDARAQGSDIWVFTRKAVEVWRVGDKAR